MYSSILIQARESSRIRQGVNFSMLSVCGKRDLARSLPGKAFVGSFFVSCFPLKSSLIKLRHRREDAKEFRIPPRSSFVWFHRENSGRQTFSYTTKMPNIAARILPVNCDVGYRQTGESIPPKRLYRRNKPRK